MQEAANFMAITKGCSRDSVTLFELGLVTRKNKTMLLSGPDICLALQEWLEESSAVLF